MPDLNTDLPPEETFTKEDMTRMQNTIDMLSARARQDDVQIHKLRNQVAQLIETVARLTEKL